MTPEEHCEWHGLFRAAALIRKLKRQVKQMPNHQDWERADFYQQEIVKLRRELKAAQADCVQVRADAAKLVHTLDCAVQLTEALISWLPEGMVLPDGVKTAKGALDNAMKELRK